MADNVENVRDVANIALIKRDFICEALTMRHV